MRAWQVIFILLLAAAIFGPAGYFCFKIFYEPHLLQQKAKEEQQRVASLPAPPDATVPIFAELERRYRQGGNLVEVRTALEEFVDTYPKSEKLDAARDLIGEINSTIYLSSRPSPDKMEYVVKSGDSLLRVQAQTKAPAELIMRANGLESIRLQIGQRLYIPKVDFKIDIYRSANRVILVNYGKFFKQYPYEPVNLPKDLAKEVRTKVTEKSALYEDRRLTFEDKEYLQSARWIVLANGLTLFSPAPEAWRLTPPARGFKMAQRDVAEIQALIKGGTPVTIME